MFQLIRRLWWYVSGTGPWFRVRYPDMGELEGQRDWRGNLWVTARDGVYEIRLRLSAADADRIAQWLLRSAHEVGYSRRQLRLVDKTKVPEQDADTY